jgi:hypothetical protein
MTALADSIFCRFKEARKETRSDLWISAVAGWSGDAERLEWPPPTPLGLLETRGDLGESGPAESSTGASRPRSDPQQWLKRISKHDTT